MSSKSEPTPGSDGDDERLRRDRDARQRRVGYQMFGIGWMSASEAIAGLALGWLVDRVLGTAPWGLIVGGVTGVAVGMWTLVRRAVQLQDSVGGRAGGGLSKISLSKISPSKPERGLSKDTMEGDRDSGQ